MPKKVINQRNDFEDVDCDFCGSWNSVEILSARDYYHRRKGVFTVHKCTRCGLVYTNSRPIPKALPRFYSGSAGYYTPQYSSEMSGFKQTVENAILMTFYSCNKPRFHNMWRILLFPLFLYKYRSIKISGLPVPKKNGVLLDVGCSYGGFLNKMRNLGWKTKGVEMNDKVSKWGRKTLGLNIYSGTFNNFQTSQRFDAIVMSMFLEHVYSPKQTLIKANRLLKNNGALIVIVPDFAGVESRLYKKYAYTLQVPTHMTHFTKRTIRKYLHLTGFKNIRIYHHQFDRDLISPLEYMIRDGKQMQFLYYLLSNKLVRKTITRWLLIILSFLGKTSRMTIYANKKHIV